MLPAPWETHKNWDQWGTQLNATPTSLAAGMGTVWPWDSWSGEPLWYVEI